MSPISLSPTRPTSSLNPLRCAAEAALRHQVGIDHIDIGFMPSEFASALAKRVLHPQTFLIAHDLVGRRLPDVDNRLARQMRRLDQF